MIKTLCCWLVALCGCWPVFSQSILLKGKVLLQPSNGVAAGATVRSVPGNQSTVTDSEGRFQLTVEPGNGARLTVTYTGYEDWSVLIDAKAAGKELLISLSPRAPELDTAEVVSTGIQTLPRSRSTGAFEKIKQEDLQLQVGPNILDRINGLVAGIRFDANRARPAVTVRGFSSINGPQNPLIVLDNFPYEGDINNINPYDIESITVLKDAAAASIWGARAGNGVIVISTRKAGRNQPVRWQLNSTARMTQKPDLFYNPENISPAEQVALEQDLFNKGFYKAAESNINRPALPPVVEWLIAARDGRVTQAEAMSAISALANTDLRSQAEQWLYQPAWYQQYNLQVSGGGAKASFNVSGGYDKSNSNLDAPDERFTLRSYGKLAVTKWWQTDINVQYTHTNSRNGRPSIDNLVTGQYRTIYQPLYDANGQPVVWRPNYRQTYTDTAGGGRLLSWDYYPLEDYRHDVRTNAADHLLLALGMQAQLVKGLQWQVQGRLERLNGQSRQLQDLESYGARSYINLFTQLGTGGNLSYGVPRGGILRSNFNTMQSLNLRTQLNYDKQWKESQLSMLAGAEIRETDNNGSGSIAYGYDDNLLTSLKVDYINSYKNYITGGNMFIADNTGFSGTNFRYASWFGNAGYTYKSRYTLTASARHDASNLFGVKSNEKGVPLWSAGFAWDVLQEPWMKDNWFSRLRLRFSTGYSGNIDPTRSAVTVIRTISGTALFNQVYGRIEQYENARLRWEKVQTHNLGIDFEMAGKRVWGSLDGYLKRGKDLFGPRPIDPTVGIPLPSVPANIAAMKGYGMELSLHSKNTKGVIGWASAILVSMADNRVTDYLSSNTTGRALVNDGRLINQEVGAPVYSVVSYAWAGLDPATGDPMGYLDKQVSKNYSQITGAGTKPGDVVQHGSAVPVWFGAVRNDLTWKGLSLTVNITWAAGYYFRRSVLNGGVYSGYGHQDYAQRWQQPGDEGHTQVPSLVYPVVARRDEFYRSSAVTVSKGDHIRLQFIEAAYRVQTFRWVKQPQRLFINIANLGLLWKANKEGLDPNYPNVLPPLAVSAGINISL